MFKALVNNVLIDAANYRKQSGDVICCADPNCGAEMVSVKATKELATFNRAKHFRTKPGETHKQGCEAHAEEKQFNKTVKSIGQSLSKGHKILFALNDLDSNYGLPPTMGRTFNSRSDPAYKNTELYRFERDNTGQYFTYSVKKIRLLQATLNMIQANYDPSVLDNVHFAWQGQVKSYDEFMCDDMDKAHEVARELYLEAGDRGNPYRFDYKGHVGAYGFPRMIPFKMTSVGKGEDIVFGAEKTVSQLGGSTIKLQQALNIKNMEPNLRKSILDGETVWVMATPKTNRTVIERSIKDLAKKRSSSIWLVFNVNNDAQCTIVPPTCQTGQRMAEPARLTI